MSTGNVRFVITMVQYNSLFLNIEKAGWYATWGHQPLHWWEKKAKYTVHQQQAKVSQYYNNKKCHKNVMHWQIFIILTKNVMNCSFFAQRGSQTYAALKKEHARPVSIFPFSKKKKKHFSVTGHQSHIRKHLSMFHRRALARHWIHFS